MSLKKFIPNKELLNSKEFKATALLFSTQVLFIVFGFFNKSIQTRTLGPEIYGNFAFFISTLMFTSNFFHLGFFSSTQVLIAESHDTRRIRELIGGGVIFFLIISGLYTCTILLFAGLIDQVYGTDLAYLFRKLSFLAPIIIFRYFVNAIATGSGKILGISLYPLTSRLVFLLALLSLVFHDMIDLDLVLTWNLLSMLIGAVAIMIFFKPKFSNMGARLKEIIKKTKEHGFHMYLGGVMQQSTYKLDEMMIPYFVGTTGLGFYTLGIALCTPIPMLSQSASRALFRKMATGDKITNTLFRFNFLWLIGTSLILVLSVNWIVPLLFGPGYEEVGYITSILVIAHIFQGLAQPFMFLNAKSQGKKVRNALFIGTIVNLVGNIALIPIWGITGAVIASIISKITNVCFKYYYYKKYLRESGAT